ncbi:UDP-4-amino-4,6-dideoxy-N-acetyl-beta-L-altrosamine N-acetyltransferase [Desulfobacterium sp. N47]|uniref:N-acetyltransferase domain-containing protein n=1 Tax=uncultured Desulfobacterium sp. TaxID=201089 RepID=E1YGX3_9BACT|nr:hypothetical protein N47_F15120 [uncultured Desulfobacterium sp.]
MEFNKLFILRDILPDDKDVIFRWRNLPEVAEYMYTDHRICYQEHEQWFDEIKHNTTKKYWIINFDSEDVGIVNLYNIDYHNMRCHWAFYLASPNIRGKGVGSFVEYSILKYVFDELKFNKLCCEVFEFNKTVINMHQSFGFEVEGRFREHALRKRQYLNVICLAMLTSVWKVHKKLIKEKIEKKLI